MNNRSSELFERAKQYIPGGVNSPVRAFGAVGRDPLFIERAKGSKIYDADGAEYIDYVCSWGPNILGHADQRIITAIQEAAERGLTYGAPTEGEVQLAQMISEAIPCAQQVRLVSCGTEAVMSAVRAARGYTGKDKIIKFRGNYHGHSDSMLVKAGSGLLTANVPDSAGVPADFAKHTLLADYNDPDSVQRLFEQYDDIAAVIVEPVAANMGVIAPKEGFLESLREMTKDHDALLIFDEVITGFRLSYGGACEYYGVDPDMVTLGKIVGGGMPLAAYAGKREIMSCIAPVGEVYQAGTLSGNPIAVTAGLRTLEILKEESQIYEKLTEDAIALEKAYEDKGLQVHRAGSLLSVFFSDTEVTDFESAMQCDLKAFQTYFHHMLDRGIYVAPSQFEAMFLSAAHSREDIAQTIDVIKEI